MHIHKSPEFLQKNFKFRITFPKVFLGDQEIQAIDTMSKSSRYNSRGENAQYI